MAVRPRWLWALAATALQLPLACALDVADTILVFAKDQQSANSATSGLQGYGIPYQTIIVPQQGITLPTLNSSTRGNYGGIITMSELSYQYPSGWSSAITDAQWQQMYDYQLAFGVRMVRIDAWPQPAFGTDVAIHWDGCCGAGVEQLVRLTNDSTFQTANLNMNQGVSTMGLWHVPATITDPSTTTQVAAFDPSGEWTSQTVAAVVNNFGGRMQMVWFMTWATDWSLTSTYLQHACIHFLTRGLFVGARKVHLNTQVDDMHLTTDMYPPAGGGQFRVRPGDLDAHVAWQTDLNTRLPAGSKYFVEVAHNGNGDLSTASAADTQNICVPDTWTLLDWPPTTPLEFVKPLGTGQDYWIPGYKKYNWTLQCAKLDSLATWFTNPTNRDAFAHLSHTFNHLYLNNATYSDTAKEIQFNQQWMVQIGISRAARFSPSGLVPPSISGMHNGDAIRAWMDNGIKYVVGDNTRPGLRNSQNSFWPRITTVADDGYAGLVTIPRWATSIYYNCDAPACTLQEWLDTSNGQGDFQDGLLADARNVNVKNLLGLHGDPFMFHQANMRNIDMPDFTVGSTKVKSLLQIWVETVAQEMTRLTNWPITSLKHDDIGSFFMDRMDRDQCHPSMVWHSESPGGGNRTFTSVTLSTDNNACGVPIPVTFPVAAATTWTGTSADRVGSEPTIIWTNMGGSSVTFTLSTPIPF